MSSEIRIKQREGWRGNLEWLAKPSLAKNGIWKDTEGNEKKIRGGKPSQTREEQVPSSEAGECSMCSRISKQGNVAGAEWLGRDEVRMRNV